MNSEQPPRPSDSPAGSSPPEVPSRGEQEAPSQELRKTARALRDSGRLDEAVAVLSGLVARHPDDFGGHFDLGRLARAQGNHALAQKHLREAVRLAPADTTAWRELAAEFEAAGVPDQARETLAGLIGRQPDSFWGHFDLARLERRLGNHAAALEELRAAGRIDPDHPEVPLQIAGNLGDGGHLADARAELRRLTERHPDYFWGHFELARLERRLGHPAEAVEQLRAAGRIDPEHPEVPLQIAGNLCDAGRPDEARGVLEELTTHHPGYYWGHFERGRLAHREADHATAQQHLRQAVAIDPANTAAYIELAADLGEAGAPDQARTVLAELIAHRPDFFWGHFEAARLARRMGAHDAALEHLAAARRIDPDHPEVPLQIAGNLRETGRLKEAGTVLAELTARHPDYYWGHFELGRLARGEGDHEAARAHLRQAIRIDPDNAAASLELVASLEDTKDFAAAIAAASTYLEKHPDNLPAWMSLGRIHRRAGEHEAALEAFRQAARHNPASLDPLVEIAEEEAGLGQRQDAEATLHAVLEREPHHLDALLKLAAFNRRGREHAAALALLEEAIAAHPASPWPRLEASTVLSEMGRHAEALDMLSACEEACGASAQIALRRISLLEGRGRWDDAFALAREACQRYPRFFWLWRQRFLLELRAGLPEAAGACLRDPPASSRDEESVAYLTRAEFAEARWNLAEAIELLRRAQECAPQSLWVCHEFFKAAYVAFDMEEVDRQRHIMGPLWAEEAARQGVSPHISQTFFGYLYDELTLDRDALAALLPVCRREPAERIGPLLAQVRAQPDYTPAAMALMVAMRQAGAFADPPPGEGIGAEPSPIPHRITQYWNKPSPPEDLSELMETWRHNNPDFTCKLFDDAAAQAFMEERYGAKVLRAYQRIREPAQRADVFRLAWLYAEGGYYIDTDDRCLAPLRRFIPPHAGLVMYQEEWGSLGNNFIGAAPLHPVIGRALHLVIEAIERDDHDIVWLASGPGLLTRAFAQALAGSDLEWHTWLRHVKVFDRLEFYRFDAPHCFAAYKVRGHWSQMPRRGDRSGTRKGTPAAR